MRLLLLIALMSCVPPARNARRIASAYEFKDADELLARGELDEAALLFTELVAADPHGDFADRALSNAAFCHEMRRHFELARALYDRVVAEYPDSKLADAALFLAAVNAEKASDFELAITRYHHLVKHYPASPHRQPWVNSPLDSARGKRKYVVPRCFDQPSRGERLSLPLSTLSRGGEGDQTRWLHAPRG